MYLGFTWEGRVFSQLSVSIISIFFCLIVLYKSNYIKLAFSIDLYKSALFFGLPLIPHAIGGWLTTWADRFIINKLVGLHDSGVYTVAVQLVQIIVIIQLAINTAFIPWLYENLKNNLKLKIVKLSYKLFIAIFAFSLLFAIFAPNLLHFFIGKDFRPSIKYVFWLSIAQGIKTIYYLTCNYIFYSGKTYLIAISTFLSAIIHFLLTYFFIKYLGVMGAVYASVLSSIFLTSITFLFSNFVIKMPWKLAFKF